jgi:hypothetical protein
MWDLWWTKWHWDSFSPEYFGFPLSISFHRCSITLKNEKKLLIFITGLHNKPQGCDASIASAAGPFTTHTQKLRMEEVTAVVEGMLQSVLQCPPSPKKNSRSS